MCNTLSREMELCRVNRDTVTQRVARYIQENHISVEQLENELGIAREKLVCADGRELDATEFLELCSYLNVRPENFAGEESSVPDSELLTNEINNSISKYGKDMDKNEKISILAKAVARVIEEDKNR